MGPNTLNPSWWNTEHEDAWASAREDFRDVAASEQVEWDATEPAIRFGHGAAHQYGAEWNDDLETQLRGDWEALQSGHGWDDVKHFVRRGWERARGKA